MSQSLPAAAPAPTAGSALGLAPPPNKRGVIYLRVSTSGQAHADGASEGYSIPAQREACTRKATELGAVVVAEFADRGESAKSAARPALQQMLALLAEHKDVDFVIVHKVDRLARNRADDVQIQMAIQKAGARLISVTESVDDTPSGKLVHNIMSDLAEFYSANLASEILKGSTQKATMGGTPYRVPIGYLNVRYLVEGREIRTGELDPERCPYMRRAFELYATGEYSLKRLHAQLTAEGLTTRPTPRQPEKPLTLSKLSKLLRNRYYLGVVTYRGVEHPGKHPAIIGADLFDRVQLVLDEREQHAIKQRRHTHYLRGILTCARCGSRMIYTTGKGKGGDIFDYFACSQRHKKAGCDLPYLQAGDIERRIERDWPRWVHLDQLDAETVGQDLEVALRGDTDHPQQLARAQRRLARRESERLKLVQMAYADAIPLDLLKTEQARIGIERQQLEQQIHKVQYGNDDIMKTYQRARTLMERGAEAYLIAGPDARRLLHRAFLAAVQVDTDDEQATLDSPWREIQAAANSLDATTSGTAATGSHDEMPILARGGQTTNPDPHCAGRGSNMNPLVELRGFEPLTPCMPCRCATSCATAPWACCQARAPRKAPSESRRLAALRANPGRGSRSPRRRPARGPDRRASSATRRSGRGCSRAAARPGPPGRAPG